MNFQSMSPIPDSLPKLQSPLPSASTGSRSSRCSRRMGAWFFRSQSWHFRCTEPPPPLYLKSYVEHSQRPGLSFHMLLPQHRSFCVGPRRWPQATSNPSVAVFAVVCSSRKPE